MRIVAGTWRGRTLKSPTWEGLRPTSDRLRETLFNIVGPAVRGARVLDGYAGTGGAAQFQDHVAMAKKATATSLARGRHGARELGSPYVVGLRSRMHAVLDP